MSKRMREDRGGEAEDLEVWSCTGTSTKVLHPGLQCSGSLHHYASTLVGSLGTLGQARQEQSGWLWQS